MQRNVKSFISWTLGIVTFVLLCVGGDDVIERPYKRLLTRGHALPFFALIDPTVGGQDYPTPELPLLRQVDPAGAAYLQSHFVTVTVLDDKTYRENFGASLSCNPPDTNAIFLDGSKLPSAKLRTVAIAHELIHVQHGDRTTSFGMHSWLQHLWLTEEGEAHLQALHVAKLLNVRPFWVPWIDYVEMIYVLPLLYLFLILDAAWFVPLMKRHYLQRQKQQLIIGGAAAAQ